jgi:signal transduction histidine kinase
MPTTEKPTPRRSLSAKARNAWVFFSALALLTAGALLTYWTVFRLTEAERWVSHTFQVQSALSSFTSAISRAGGRRVEYVHTGEDTRLSEYQVAVVDTLQDVDRLRTATADNPVQQKNCDQLAILVHQRIDLMNQSITFRQRDQFDLNKEADLTQSIVRVAQQMDSLTSQMRRVEGELLTNRQLRAQILFRQQIILFSAAFLIAVILLSLHYYLLNRELEARQLAEESLRRLNARLLEMQDAERRKVSRELHESIGQYLSGVKMSLEVVRKSIPQNALLAESVSIIDKSISETRAISQLLHPPLLDEIGFASAARWYVEGFSERSGVRVQLHLPENLRRFPGAVELALFRVLQESLTSLHEHTKTSRVEVSVRLLGGEVEMRVKDGANGMSQAALDEFYGVGDDLGSGMAGMRDRLRELGGRLEIQSNAEGTLIVATLPIAQSAAEKEDERKRHARMD